MFVAPGTLLVQQNHVKYLVRFSVHLSEGFTPAAWAISLLVVSNVAGPPVFLMIQKWLLHGDAALPRLHVLSPLFVGLVLRAYLAHEDARPSANRVVVIFIIGHHRIIWCPLASANTRENKLSNSIDSFLFTKELSILPRLIQLQWVVPSLPSTSNVCFHLFHSLYQWISGLKTEWQREEELWTAIARSLYNEVKPCKTRANLPSSPVNFC